MLQLMGRPCKCGCRNKKSTFPLTLTTCGPCSSAISLWWELAIAGVADDDCADCNVLNGTFSMKMLSATALFNFGFSTYPHTCHIVEFPTPFSVGDACTSTSPSRRPRFHISHGVHYNVGGSCNGSTSSWQLWINQETGGTVTRFARYQLNNPGATPDVFNCQDDNVFDLCLNTSECQSWPSSLTITPIPAP